MSSSYGAQRCRLLAEALVTAHENGAGSTDDRMTFVRERFREAGTSVETPYLGPDSPGDIDLAPAPAMIAEEGSPCH